LLVAAHLSGLPTNPRNGRFLLLAQLLGLGVSGWLVWSKSVVPTLAKQSFANMAARAAFYVLLAWALSALITFLVYLVVGDEEPEDLVPVSLQSSAVAVWYAPAIILLSTLSPAGLLASLVIVVTTSRLLILGWLPMKSEAAPPLPVWNPLPAVFAALVFQGAGVALVWKNPVLAAASFALSLAMVTALAVIRSGSKPERPAPMPPSALSVALTILLAVAFSTATLKFTEYAAASGSSDTESGPGAVNTTALPDPAASGFGSGGFPGVILRRVHKAKSMTLVVPRLNFSTESEKVTRPLTIPFTGEYWMYQPPFIQPPRTSVVREGTPLELSFHTSNGTMLSMEARQRLGTPVELSCCGRLDVEIAQRGQFAELLLKVTLTDSQTGRNLELGMEPVGLNASETLHYSIPSDGALKKFDEIRVVYRRRGMGYSKSISVAVEEFRLVPRGQ
jgi:hypothetical protein